MRFLSHLRIPTVLPSLSVSTTTIPYKREESRGDQANGSFWARRNRELCSTQHALRINIEANFYAVTARLERQRKKKRKIAVSSGLLRTIVRNIGAGDLFGRMWGAFAATRGTRHPIGK